MHKKAEGMGQGIRADFLQNTNLVEGLRIPGAHGHFSILQRPARGFEISLEMSADCISVFCTANKKQREIFGQTGQL